MGAFCVHTPFTVGQPYTHHLPFTYQYGMEYRVDFGSILNLFWIYLELI